MGKIIFILLFIGLGVSGQAQSCKGYFHSLSLSQSVRELQELRIVSYNMLNLYVHLGDIHKDHTVQVTQKPQWALEEMAESFRRHPFDIMIAQEIESVNSAKLFNRDYLNDEFDIYSTQTRDIRGLFVVFFVRKTLPFKFQMESHIKEKWIDPIDNVEKEIFPRDLPTLQIYDPQFQKKPLMTIIGAHLKSLRDRTVTSNGQVGMDSGSYLMREAQAHRATKIIQRYQLKHGLNHPILIAGDFNNSHNYSPEFYGFFRHTKLQDSVSLIKENKFADKITHSYFGQGYPQHHQLDGILMVPSVVSALLDSYIIPYYDADGMPRDLPQTKHQRKKNPSDHWPVRAVFSFQRILETLDQSPE